MELSKELGNNVYKSLTGKEDLRFELYDWLKSKGLSAKQATDLLAMTKEAISDARHKELEKIML